ncbi:MAG: ribonuclease HII [Bacteroidales bacterium]|nr:ribonuclease HII [Bacteroidales bacterium]
MLKLSYQTNLIEVGIDEAGRGCLAGPVFAAAVILPNSFISKELNDSKKLHPNKRTELRKIIELEALDFSVAYCTHDEIDRWNIFKATMVAMHRCLDKLKMKPEFIVVDGNKFFEYRNIPYKTIVKGDETYMNIAAASILAKTYRDEYMKQLHVEFPMYGWNENKGYPTEYHVKAIEKYGYSPYHRRTFQLKGLQLKIF